MGLHCLGSPDLDSESSEEYCFLSAPTRIAVALGIPAPQRRCHSPTAAADDRLIQQERCLAEALRNSHSHLPVTHALQRSSAAAWLLVCPRRHRVFLLRRSAMQREQCFPL